jgi:hypothetical protein
MKKTTKILFFLLLVAGVATATVFLVAADNNKPYLPGITVADEYPNGCVDCHKVSGENDYRLNVELAELDGHPKIDAIVKTVPQDCLMCHKEGANAGALHLITHEGHYHNPGDNAFVKFYQGACLQCHSVNPGSGKMGIKNGPKNW